MFIINFLKKLRYHFLNFCYHKIYGWKIIGRLPDFKKLIIVIAPHTSATDFFIAATVMYLHNIKGKFLIKDTFFNIPLINWYLRKIGAIPVNRSKHNNIVNQVVELINKSDEFVLTLTPEGTRAYRKKWKTGFYKIAMETNIPIVVVGFDYKKKTVEYKKYFFARGDMDKDIEMMKEYYRTVTGKYPEKGVR